MPGKGFADPEHRAKHGNLKGRPVGFGALVREAKKLAEDELPAIVAKMVEMAKQGDMVAASFLVSRFIPLPKPTDHTVTFDLPPGLAAGDLDGVTMAVLKAVSEGKLDPTSAAKLTSALTAHVHLASTKDVQRMGERLADVERMMQGKPTLNAEGWPMEPGTPTPMPHETEEYDNGKVVQLNPASKRPEPAEDGNPPDDFHPAA
jgi:hypothetical protein